MQPSGSGGYPPYGYPSADPSTLHNYGTSQSVYGYGPAYSGGPSSAAGGQPQYAAAPPLMPMYHTTPSHGYPSHQMPFPQQNVVYSGLHGAPTMTQPALQPGHAPAPYSMMPVPHVHAGRQGLYQSLPPSPLVPPFEHPAPPHVHSQLSQSQTLSDQHTYPTLESLEASGEIHEVAPPSIETITEAARVAERQQMDKRAQASSHYAASTTYSTASTNIVHRSSSAPLTATESASGDKTAIGKMAATLGSKFTDITRLSLNMAKNKISAIGEFVTLNDSRSAVQPPLFGYDKSLFAAFASRVSFDEPTFQQLFFLFRSICKVAVGTRIRPSTSSEALSASFSELCTLFPTTTRAETIQLASRLICTPEKGNRSKTDFETFVISLNTLVHGSKHAQMSILFDALTEYGRNPLTSSRLMSLCDALVISDEKKLSLSISSSAQPSAEIILSREEFCSIFQALQISPEIIQFVCDCLHHPAKALVISSDAGGVGPVSSSNPSLQQMYRHKEGFLLKHLGSVMDKWSPHWCVLHDGIFYYYKDIDKYSGPERAISVVNARVERIFVPEKTTDVAFKVSINGFSRKFICDSEEDLTDWLAAFESHRYCSNRHESSFPIRDMISGEAFVDGEEGYSSILLALQSARESIYISDWFFSPEVFLKRGSSGFSDPMHRLDNLLKAKAEAGVLIAILVWNETKVAMPLNSEYVQNKMQSLNKANIFVQRHPLSFPVKWSHHQKIVVVDQDIAYLGGLDLCFGRYDDQNHYITDPDAKIWPGKDYYNPAFSGLDNLHRFAEDSVDRRRHPRMGWHDIHVRVDGLAARDVSRNFIERWNFAKEDLQRISTPYLVPKLTSPSSPETGSLQCQIVRSLGDWHLRNFGGESNPEVSINRAYLNLIAQAERFIYIENQYFISNLAGEPVVNSVAAAILDKLRSAISGGRIFRVAVILPVHPEGSFLEDAAIRYVMHFQYHTISRGASSLISILSREFPGVDLSQYISFHALRKAEFLVTPSSTTVVTEQIYVHSKLMIVDDRAVLVGSANINDRSLAGDRDSEIGIIIEDHEVVDSTMNGEPFKVRRLAHELRKKLWREHLGFASMNDSIRDPLLPSVWNDIWLATAKKNTELFRQAFPLVPDDRITTLEEMEKPKLPDPALAQRILQDVRGHLIEYPLNFLANSRLNPNLTDVNMQVVDSDIFT